MPVHIHYIGPAAVEHIYLLGLDDTLNLMLFNYGGQSVNICPPATRSNEHSSMFSNCTVVVVAAVSSVVGFALQQGPTAFIAELPFLRTFSEPGCALWRLAQSASARADTFQQYPIVNDCHHVLCQLPLIIIEGRIKGGCLSICPLGARALHPQEQPTIWGASVPFEYCILFVCQAVATYDEHEYNQIVTVAANEHFQEYRLPEVDVVLAAAKQLYLHTCIDLCQQARVENGWYVCIYGEAARLVFQRAQALISVV